MVGIFILTHGGLARELLRSASRIVGRPPGFRALNLDWDDSFEEASAKAAAILRELRGREEVLILTDLHGSTPDNVARSFREVGRVEVLAGVNLPMVVRLACPGTRDKPLTELVSWIEAKGRSSICGPAACEEPPRGEPREGA